MKGAVVKGTRRGSLARREGRRGSSRPGCGDGATTSIGVVSRGGRGRTPLRAVAAHDGHPVPVTTWRGQRARIGRRAEPMTARLVGDRGDALTAPSDRRGRLRKFRRGRVRDKEMPWTSAPAAGGLDWGDAIRGGLPAEPLGAGEENFLVRGGGGRGLAASPPSATVHTDGARRGFLARCCPGPCSLLRLSRHW